jgi:hypothetical protein
VGWVKGYEVDYKICGILTRVLCVINVRLFIGLANFGFKKSFFGFEFKKL